MLIQFLIDSLAGLFGALLVLLFALYRITKPKSKHPIMNKSLWLLRLIRIIVNQICQNAYAEDQDPNARVDMTEARHRGIASEIRDILVRHNINEN